MKYKILFVTYDGLTDALGQSQILSYLTGLSSDFEFTVLSFEKKISYHKNFDQVAKRVDSCGIHWIYKWYTRKPPIISTLYNIRTALREVKKLHNTYKYDILHCRGYIPALVGLYLKEKYHVPFIFDMRGWWADEKLEAGSWSPSYFKPIYEFFKRKEKEFFSKADFIVSLTEAGKNEIEKQYTIPASKIGVVPTCVDLEIFSAPNNLKKKEKRAKLGIPSSATVLVYSGAIGGNYDLNILLTVFKNFNALFPEPYILILIKDELSLLQFKDELQKAHINNFLLCNALYREVSDYLCAADVGLIFYKPAFSNIGRSPTKLGEYWASGIPIIATDGIGDLNLLQQRYPFGLVIINNSLKDIDKELIKLKFNNQSALRAYAEAYCSLENGIMFYKKVYLKLLK